jgi:von willebrand factor, type A
LRLPSDLLPAERHARRVRGGVNPHNSSKDGGTGRYVALVDFNTNATVADAGWQDVSTEAGYTAILTAINDLKPDGGTNLDDGLQNANLLFAKSNVQEIDSKNIIALTDGEPTYYMTKDIFGNPTVGGFGNSCTKEVFEATANTAASICNSGTTLYSICFGAANEEVKNPNTGAYISLFEYLNTYIAYRPQQDLLC